MNQQKDTSASENLQKMQQDRLLGDTEMSFFSKERLCFPRMFLQNVLSSTLTELNNERSFFNLTRTVQEENGAKKNQLEMIKRQRRASKKNRGKTVIVP